MVDPNYDSIALSEDGGAVIISLVEQTFGDLYGVRITEEGLFHGTPATCRKRLENISLASYVASGEDIFQEGTSPGYIYLLSHGLAEIASSTERGRPVRKTAAEHEIFGIPEAFGNYCFQYGVTALTPCRVDRVTVADFEAFLRADPISLFRIIRILGLAVQMRQRLMRSI